MKIINVKQLVISALTADAFGAIGVRTLFTENAETAISVALSNFTNRLSN